MAPRNRARPPPAALMHPMHLQQAQQSRAALPNLRKTPDRQRTRRTSSPDPLQTEPVSEQIPDEASSPTGQHGSFSISTAARHFGPPTGTPNWLPPRTYDDTPQQGDRADESSPVAADSSSVLPPSTTNTPTPPPTSLSESGGPFHYTTFTCSGSNIDLNSVTSTQTSGFSVVDRKVYEKPLYIIPTASAVALCLHTKQWLLDQFRRPELSAPNILRVDNQSLHELGRMSTGHLVIAQYSIYLDQHPEVLGTILAVSVPKDPNLRLFYTILPIAPLLRHLSHNNCLKETVKRIPPSSKHHNRLHHFLTETFLASTTPSHHPDYSAAEQITDYCPSILDPSTAFSRLESNETLYFATSGVSEPLDLSRDRYTHTLHPAESSLAADLKLACSAYLLLKRRFFQAFWKECVAHKGRIGATEGGSRVRSEHAHEVWLVEEMKWKMNRARRLVVAWRILGFLEERMFLPWLREGGMLEKAGRRESEEG
ncbi:hypothetical protein D0869_02112 [Hortaea werneckii]|uniref:Uncharacterized protein n=1 Tax=Hortaea werneckii TaxID=91943 RepID=A0A3M6Z1H3_HORWE|nr:hypothetical protein KC324_g6135 [Hortaea werneckii]KAI7585616.1 hypothetical protein KC316_g6075 [Hortaea werneckii]RMX87794.1 hypothetical protein D0869_02112 [Hortaea werneckii]RMY09088.1 hypothetical protein D0868_04441 [Hortaea werneckii]